MEDPILGDTILAERKGPRILKGSIRVCICVDNKIPPAKQ
jgi:hypothetical protein